MTIVGHTNTGVTIYRNKDGLVGTSLTLRMVKYGQI